MNTDPRLPIILAALAVSAAAQQPQFSPLGAPATPIGPVLATGDVDGDGDIDVVSAGFVHRNDGRGRFVSTALPAILNPSVPGLLATSIALGDVDGDGDPDIVLGVNWAYSTGPSSPYGQTRLLLNDGTGVFSDATIGNMPSDAGTTESVILVDVDGDSDLDLVIANGQEFCPTGGLCFVPTLDQLYLNDGHGVFTDASVNLPNQTTWARHVTAADVDGDGDVDLHFATRRPYTVSGGTPSGDQNLLYINDGTGTFTDETASRLPNWLDGSNGAAFGDVDGDGDLDLAVANEPAFSIGYPIAQSRLLLNDGSGSFTVDPSLPLDLEWDFSVSMLDMDMDGDLDLLFGASSLFRTKLLRNDGPRGFSDIPSALPSTTGFERTVVADVDDDGDADLIQGSGVLFNLHRQLDAPSVPQAGQPYTLDVYRRNPTSSLVQFALPFLSITETSIPIPGLGTLSIVPQATLPAIVIPQPAGVGSVTWQVPSSPGVIGVPLHAQALIVDYLGVARLSNVVSGTVQ